MLNKQNGFSLVELAVVLAILGILTTGVLLTYTGQRDVVKAATSEKRLAQVKKALLSFEMVNRYLPCPDSDSDGVENRQNDYSCTQTYGDVPFQDLGLSLADVQDSFGANIRYAVNQGVTSFANMQNAGHSASYFCDQDCKGGAELPMFSLTTPPVSGNLGQGNYSICNYGANSCGAGLASSNYLADGQSIILVAFNSNGLQTAQSCNGLATREAENCDLDLFYWDSIFNKDAVQFFDDQVIGISGYEIKQELLKNDASVFNAPLNNNNNNTQNNTLIAPPPPPTNPTNTIAGNYTGPSDYNPPSGNFSDSLKVGGDLNAVLDLNNGNNELTVTGNQNSAIISGSGNDNFYIEGDAKSSITTGSGNDNLTILGSLTSVASVDMGSGTDFVYVIGDVNGSVDLGSGDDTFRVDGDLAHTIYGGAGTDVIYVNKTPEQWTASSQASYLNGFERIRFNDGTAQDL